MTPESSQSIKETPVRVARRHRIKQRLGQLSTGGRFDHQVTAPLSRLERQQIPANDLLTAVVTTLHSYEQGEIPADQRSIYISKYVLGMTRKILPLLQAPERRPVRLELLSHGLFQGQEFPLAPTHPTEAASDAALRADLTTISEVPEEVSV